MTLRRPNIMNQQQRPWRKSYGQFLCLPQITTGIVLPWYHEQNSKSWCAASMPRTLVTHAARFSQCSTRHKAKTCSPSQPLGLRRNTTGIVFGLPSRASAGLGAACKSLGRPVRRCRRAGLVFVLSAGRCLLWLVLLSVVLLWPAEGALAVRCVRAVRGCPRWCRLSCVGRVAGVCRLVGLWLCRLRVGLVCGRRCFCFVGGCRGRRWLPRALRWVVCRCRLVWVAEGAFAVVPAGVGRRVFFCASE